MAMSYLFLLSFVRLLPETRTCRALADWPSSVAAVSGRSAAGPVMPDILMAAGAYRVGHSSRTDLYCCCRHCRIVFYRITSSVSYAICLLSTCRQTSSTTSGRELSPDFVPSSVLNVVRLELLPDFVPLSVLNFFRLELSPDFVPLSVLNVVRLELFPS